MARARRRGAFILAGALFLGACNAPGPPPAAVPIAPVNVMTTGVLYDMTVRSERPRHRWVRWGLEEDGVAPFPGPRVPRSPAYPARSPNLAWPWSQP